MFRQSKKDRGRFNPRNPRGFLVPLQQNPSLKDNFARLNVLGSSQCHSFELPFRVNKMRNTTQALIDSGATHSFIHYKEAIKLKIPWKTLSDPITILNVDGSTNDYGKVTKYVEVELSTPGWKHPWKLLITNLYDSQIILGADWLVQANPHIDWRDKAVSFHQPTIRTIKGSTTIPLQYQEFADVFSEQKATRFPITKKWDMEIPLEIPSEDYEKKIGRGRIYSMTQEERKELSQWIDENLQKGYIRPSRSPIAAPVFFIPKKDGKKRLVQDYRRLNKVTTADSYPIPIMRTLAERVEGATIFTALDLRWGYHNVRIKEGDEWKAAFSTPRGLFEPTVMLFGMKNSPATFQRMMDEILRGTEHFTVVYLDDILIFSKTLKEHREHVREVLKRL